MQVNYRMKQAQVQGKCNAVCHFSKPLESFLVLEPFEMNHEDWRKLFNFHSLFRFLETPTRVAVELVAVTKDFGCGKVVEASGQRGVGLNVQREIQEWLIPVRCLICEFFSKGI